MTATKIEWATDVWNPLRGCSPVSEGCRNCYAQRMAHRFSGKGQPYEGLTSLTKNGPRWTGEVRVIEDKLREPEHWRKPRRAFVNSMSDLFHENLSFEEIDRVMGVMRAHPAHSFLILTKRPGRLRQYAQSRGPFPDHMWFGVSAEDGDTIWERLGGLIDANVRRRFVSLEPLIGSAAPIMSLIPFLDWVIVGGESGPGARPIPDLDDVRRIRDACVDEHVPFFFKQMAKKAEIPEDLLIREIPREIR